MTPSLGTLIGLPILLLAAAAAAAAGVLLWRYRHRASRTDRPTVTALALGAYALTAALLIGTAIGMWPYSGEYHSWRDTTGTVQALDARLVSAGDSSMNQRFVVTFTDGRQRACDDTRCATVKPGDRLTLKCKRAYQWGSTPGWDCNWVGNARRRA
ncbi:hypothetical protein [Actinomadura geliboluensis]|uniref:hypothetical protein n=1 Tax=Actinomadura geliboluensis TaxID=882440 RepID=UPI0036796335